MTMRIGIGADHGGYELKQELVDGLRELKYVVDDVGTHNADPSDFPDFGHIVARGVAARTYDRGILLDGTGIGMGIVANRYAGVRCANCADVFSARYSRLHNDANVLALGGRVIGVGLAWEIVNVWLAAEFSGGDRHVRRLNKIEMR
jgi:ribose 5-phosphate isomerase B